MVGARGCGFAAGSIVRPRVRRGRELGRRTRVCFCCSGFQEEDNRPSPRRRRYTLRGNVIRVQDLPEVSSPADADEGRREAYFMSTVRALDSRDLWRKLSWFVDRLLGVEVLSWVARLGMILLRSAGTVFGPLVDFNFDREAALGVEGQIELEYGITAPNEGDRFFVDPLEEWQLTSVTYYLDSFGNKVHLSMLGLIGADEFEELESLRVDAERGRYDLEECEGTEE